jgi:hypothetical protein
MARTDRPRFRGTNQGCHGEMLNTSGMRRQAINHTRALCTVRARLDITHSRPTNVILGWETSLSVPSNSHYLVYLSIQTARIPPPGGSSSPTLRRADDEFEYFGSPSSRCNLSEASEAPTTLSSDPLHRSQVDARSPMPPHPRTAIHVVHRHMTSHVRHRQATPARHI